MQYFLDRICIYVQFPRILDEYTMFSRVRRFRHASLFLDEYATIHKGAFFTGHHWALSPMILFRYAADEPAAFNYFRPSFLGDYGGPVTAVR